MAGGIFTDRPFEPNMKCIWFSIFLIIAYVYVAASVNYYMLPIIFIVAYVGLAWYDYAYDCDNSMKTGYASPTGAASILKPQQLDSQYQTQQYKKYTYLFHVAAVVPLLGYIAYRGKDTSDDLFKTLGGTAAIAGLYHGFMLIK